MDSFHRLGDVDKTVKDPCIRTIPNIKLEKNVGHKTTWWAELFEMLEHDFNIGSHKRYSILKEILPRGVLAKILATLAYEQEKFPSEEYQTPQHEVTESVNSSVHTIVETELDADTSTVSEFEKNLGITRKKKNLYMEFFKRKPDRAAIWRDLPALKWKEMTLSEMADSIATAIAADFIRWLGTIGGAAADSVNVQSIKEMFEVGTQSGCAGTISVKLQELATVTQKTADSVGMPEKSRPNYLQNQIRLDHKTSKNQPNMVAFGTRLPAYMQVLPPPKDLYKKWLKCEHIPERLESMATVWQGITHLKSTRAFCAFLYNERPHIKPPKYLVEAGLMDPKVFGKELTQAEELLLAELAEESVDALSKPLDKTKGYF